MITPRKSLLSNRLTPARVALLYATFAVLLIVVSGNLLTISVADPVLMGRIELAKGLVFVVVTSVLLYLLLRVRGATRMPDAGGQPIGNRRLMLIFAALVMVVPLIGFAITKLYGPQIEREAYANLKVIAKLKAEQIENWLDERYGDSEALFDEVEFAELIDRFVQQGQDAKLRKLVLDRFERMLTDYRYSKIMLLDTSGRLLLSSGEDVTTSPVLPGLIRQALASKQVQRRDIYRDEAGHIHLEWAVPLVVPDAQGKRVVAVVVLRVTAQRFIFPLIQTWPTASASGETMLVRSEGESVIYLNELRHRSDTALTLKLLLSDPELPAAIAVRATKPGTAQGKDYRGVPVLSAYRPVTGTNWQIVAKIDRAEVLVPLRDLVMWVSLIALAAIVAVGAAVLLLWRQQQRAHRAEMRVHTMAAIEESERRYRRLFESAKDGILILDAETGMVEDVNPFLVEMLGFSHEEFLGKKMWELGFFKDILANQQHFVELQQKGYQRYEDLPLETADGRVFHVEFISNVYLVDQHKVIQCNIRDITVRKVAEAKIQRLTQFYAALSQCNEAIVRCASEEELFRQICRAAVQFGGMKMAWVGLVDEASQRVNPAASYGEGTEYLEGIRISTDGADPAGRGPVGTAIREGKLFWIQDFLHDPLTAPWHERSARFAWGGAASLPLRRNGVVIGAFSLYSGEVNAFDEAARKLLVEMAADISFALDGFDREAKRKQAELALMESERHFHSLFENMLDGFTYCRMLYDAESRPVDFVYLNVNAAFERITGLKNVLGKRVSEVIPGIRELSPELFEAYARVASTGIPETFEFDFKSQGQWYYISVYSMEKEHFVAVFDDITERKQSVQVLAESEQRFRSLVEQSLAGIYIIQDGRFAYVNPRFAEIFGYASASELIGVDPLSLVVEQERGLVAENIRRRIKGEVQRITYGFTAVRKDGSLIDVGVHGAQATHNGRPAIIGLMQDVSEKKRAEEQIQRYIKQLEDAFMRTVEVATTLVEMRDPYTAGHEKRVAQIAVAIGTELGLDEHRIEGLRVGGYIHDIGKIIVPTEILSKPGKISAAEYELIKGHPKAGYDILKNVDFPWPVADMAYQHHERMDGSGYPRGLKGEEILLEARIMAVADVVEAISSHRPYRPVIGIEQALAEIERGSGKDYDPVVVAACLRLFREKGFELPV